jgi:hypothetical protein
MRAITLTALLLLSACAAGESPKLACQKRLVGVHLAQPLPGDEYNHRAYATLDRTGCTAKQLAALKRFTALTSNLPALTEANERIGKSGIEAAHMIAFQAMNNALIELNDLQQSIRVDLARMEQAQ